MTSYVHFSPLAYFLFCLSYAPLPTLFKHSLCSQNYTDRLALFFFVLMFQFLSHQEAIPDLFYDRLLFYRCDFDCFSFKMFRIVSSLYLSYLLFSPSLSLSRTQSLSYKISLFLAPLSTLSTERGAPGHTERCRTTSLPGCCAFPSSSSTQPSSAAFCTTSPGWRPATSGSSTRLLQCTR